MRRTGSLLAALTLLVGAVPASAAGQAPSGAVKAAFLLKLGAFATHGGEPLSRSVCTLGRDEVTDSLSFLKRSPGDPEVRRLDTAAAAGGCSLLYTTQDLRARSVEALRDIPVLTVGDGEDSGAVVSFVVREQRVRFVIDLAEARRRGIELSSKLLSLAINIRP